MKTLDTQTFLEKQFIDTKLNRYDVFVRCLAIDEYFGRNNYGFALYKKMQQKRIGSAHGCEEKFRKLIQSIDEQGYDPKYPVGVANNVLCDGSHRISCIINFNLPNVMFDELDKAGKVSYDKGWFTANFLPKEMELIEAKRLEIFDRYGFYFYIMLWNSMTDNFDDIENDIAKKHRILESRTLEMNVDFIRRIYSCDDIAEWKVEKKIQNMKGRGSTFRMLKVDIPSPNWRTKQATGKPLSQAGEKIKHTYRNRYMKTVPNYFHDIIIHTSDNFEQTRFIRTVIDEMYPKS